MTGKDGASARATAARLAVRRGEFVQLRRRLLSKIWVWAVIFVIGGAVLVTPGRGHRYPVLVSGQIATSDIVVDRDVTLSDSESTEEKKRRAAMDVLPVWVLDPNVENSVLARLTLVFSEGRRLSEMASDKLAVRVSEVSGLVILAREAQVLEKANFSEDLLLILSEVIKKIYRQGLVADRAELLQVGNNGITLRVLGSKKEQRELDVYRFLDGGASVAELIEQRLADEPTLVRSWRSPLAIFLARAMIPNVLYDRAETISRRMKAESSVEEVSVRLLRGKILLRRGDEATVQTSRLLAALAETNTGSVIFLPLLGALILAALLAASWYFYLQKNSSSKEDFHLRFGAFVVLMTIVLALQRGFVFLSSSMAGSVLRDPFGQVDIYLPALPHAVGPILAGLMFGLPVGILFAVSQAVLIGLMIGGDVTVTIFAVVVGVAAAFASQRLKERYVLARVGALVALVSALAIVGVTSWQGGVEDPRVLVAQIGAAMFGGLLAAALASFLLPVLESLTGTVTDIRLLELSNPNMSILKRLALEAPGTFQHSLAMANLAETAAEAVGANSLLVRVCCYYHDIGKLSKPEYFIENQRGNDNPHDHLTPWMSSLVVSNHVKAGLEIARQYRLPEPVREAIATHHGTKLIRFFYSRAKELENPDQGEVQENEFRYPGPRPTSKEMGILMMADAIEAASRTISDPTPGRIQSMIDQITKSILEDEQLDDCELTLKDIEKIGAEFFWVLSSAFHHRIDYPGFEFNGKRRG